MKKAFCILYSVFCIHYSYGQSTFQLITKDTVVSTATDILIDNNRCIISSMTQSYDINEKVELSIINTDLNGQNIYRKIISGNGYLVSRNLIKINNNSFLQSAYDAYYDNSYLINFDSTYTIKWSKEYDNMGIKGVLKMNDGFIIYGVLYKNNQDLLVIRLDSVGNVVWVNTLGGWGVEIMLNAIITKENEILLAGYSDTYPYVDAIGNMIISKFNENGVLKWSRMYFYQTPYSINTRSINQLNDGNYIVSFEPQKNAGDRRHALLKIDTAGNVLWCKEYYAGHNRAQAYNIIELLDSSIIAGGIDDISNTDFYSTLLKVDKDGNMLWHKSYSNANANLMCDALNIAGSDDGGIMMCGYCWDKTGPVNRNNAYIEKVDSMGHSACGNETDLATTVTDVAVTWIKADSTFPYTVTVKDYPVTVRDIEPNVEVVCFDTSVGSKEQIEPNELQILGDNIPNPFRNTSIIPYSIPDNIKKAELLITDLLGNPLQVYNLLTTNYSVEVNSDALESGTYLYILYIDGNPVQAKRMIIIK